MENEMFVVIVGALSSLLLRWGFKTLPDERWQIMAAIPTGKIDGEKWNAVNLTYYGVFCANAYTSAVIMLFVLFGALRIDVLASLALVAVMMVFCIPAAGLLAMLVEKKAHTRTVGGAVFVGTLIAPLSILGVNKIIGLDAAIPYMPALAALAVSYAFGEGLGRLACISFGCCYGKPLSTCSPFLQKLFRKYNFIFSGRTKKIAYESGLEGKQVIPIQAVTSCLYVATGLFCAYMFLKGLYTVAFFISLLVTQGWRFLSETLRADHRGGGPISLYQYMSVGVILYSLVIWGQLPETTVTPTVMAGIRTLWQPEIMITLLLMWLGIFLHTGWSKVTGSTVSFHVHEHKI